MGPHPKVSVRGLHQWLHGILVGRARDVKVDRGKLSCVEAGEAGVSANPEETVPSLNYGVHDVVWETVFNCEVRANIVICSPTRAQSDHRACENHDADEAASN